MATKRELLASTLDISRLNRLLLRVHRWSGLLVLNYHRIGDWDKSLLDRHLFSASAENFEKQIRYLTSNFDLIGLDDLEDVLNKKSGRHVMISFDDGYRDNYEHAFPVLKNQNAPATFFLTTGYLDNMPVPWWDEIAWMVRSATSFKLPQGGWLEQPLEWNEQSEESIIHQILKCYKQLPPHQTEPFLNFLAEETNSGRYSQPQEEPLWMTWDMVREMRFAGMSFGGHTVNHPVLSTLSKADQNFEIAECKRRLEEELNEPVETFSYPVGGVSAFNQITQECLKENGFRWAFSYYGGYHRFASATFNPFDLPRIPIEPDVDIPQLRSLTALPQLFA